MIWTVNIVIYIACAITQSQSYSLRSSTSSNADVLNNLQYSLSQLLSVYMVYILFNCDSPTSKLKSPYYFWFALASLLPIIASATYGAHPDISALLSYLG